MSKNKQKTTAAPPPEPPVAEQVVVTTDADAIAAALENAEADAAKVLGNVTAKTIVVAQQEFEEYNDEKEMTEAIEKNKNAIEEGGETRR